MWWVKFNRDRLTIFLNFSVYGAPVLMGALLCGVGVVSPRAENHTMRRAGSIWRRITKRSINSEHTQAWAHKDMSARSRALRLKNCSHRRVLWLGRRSASRCGLARRHRLYSFSKPHIWITGTGCLIRWIQGHATPGVFAHIPCTHCL